MIIVCDPWDRMVGCGEGSRFVDFGMCVVRGYFE